ncbi:hypothetical protein FKW77_004998 [Venturia effusa]|uniref:Pectate lyase domain-containing protein n=1 Tax=Venturia effusa TaxID=50376 RepID=A0A517KWA7_9PEZI|nr:hypothetical protein FKW77_004998 [Venturia effusa]
MKFTNSCLAGLSYTICALARPLERANNTTNASSLRDVASVGYATMNGGTSGGKAGAVINVASTAALEKACAQAGPAIIVVSGKISSPAKIRVSSNKSIIGKDSQAELAGVGLLVLKQKNVIIRNLKIHHVQAKNGDAITIQASTNVWVDHVDLSSDKTHGKDYYDGLIDMTHGSDYVTISNSRIHDHYKASLVGHSEKNVEEDRGKLHVTYAYNYWENINSRAPSLRFGSAHIFDSVFVNVNDGINVRKGAQVLVENDAFVGSSKPLYTVDATGSAVERDNDFGASDMTAFKAGKVKSDLKTGSFKSAPYKYTLQSTEEMKKTLPKTAGNTLSF